MLKFGIAGMGKMGSFHADWILQNKDMELVALCEKNEARMNELKERYKIPVYSDLDEFLKEEMDFVVVVTTNEVHELITVKALDAGKSVIVEKPMSMTYDSTLRMIEAAERNKKHLFVHHSSRWDRDYLLVRDTIKSGKLGDILCIKSCVMLCDIGWPAWGIDGMENPWRIKAQYGGGMLFDWGSHLVDQMLLLMDKDPIGVYGVLQKGVWSKEVDDYFFALLRFDCNTVCQIEVSNNSQLDLPRWFVIGTKGTLTVKGKYEPVWGEAEMVYENEYGYKDLLKFDMIGVKESGAEGGFYADLVPYLEGKKKEFVSMYEASKVIKVLEMIKKSSEENRFVSFQEV